jgi:hypothetical protein
LDFPMYLPHLPPCAPGSGWASFCFANSPAHNGLVCDFCSSSKGFAAGFLQIIPPLDGHPCLRLTLLAAKRVADFNRQVCAHAGRTKGISGVPRNALRYVLLSKNPTIKDLVATIYLPGARRMALAKCTCCCWME